MTINENNNNRMEDILKKIKYLAFKSIYQPGHYHSPITGKGEILRREKQIFNFCKEDLRAIEFNEKGQLELLEKFKKYYGEIPFKECQTGDLRYFFNNPSYRHSDAIFLYCVMRHFQPNAIIEVGCGFSSAVMLDTNDACCGGRVQCTFIDPHPGRLMKLLSETDLGRHRVIKSCVQDADITIFDNLNRNDILFVDSSHVSKTGSDVNHIVFNILPRLRPGVLIHFHDIFYPFEYPKSWCLEGRCWNEDYLLRAFLSYNREFEIIAFNTFLEYFYKSWFQENMPLCLKNKGGSLWLRKN